MSDPLNGIIMPQIQIANPLVDMLSKALDDAKAGRINTAGLVLATPQGQVMTLYAGARMLDMLGGAAILQSQILKALDEQRQGRPSLVRAVPAG